MKAYGMHLEYHRYLESVITELTKEDDAASRDAVYDFLSRLERRLICVSREDGVKSGLVPDENEMRRQLKEEKQ